MLLSAAVQVDPSWGFLLRSGTLTTETMAEFPVTQEQVEVGSDGVSVRTPTEDHCRLEQRCLG